MERRGEGGKGGAGMESPGKERNIEETERRRGGKEWRALMFFAFLNKIMYFCVGFKLNVYVA